MRDGLSKALEQSPDSFRNTYGFEKPEKHREIVFYCRGIMVKLSQLRATSIPAFSLPENS